MIKKTEKTFLVITCNPIMVQLLQHKAERKKRDNLARRFIQSKKTLNLCRS